MLIANMTWREKLAQLLIPTLGSYAWNTQVFEDGFLDETPLGGVFVGGATTEIHREKLATLQSASKIPLVVASDLECGAGGMVHGAQRFPDMLALAAANDPALAATLGRASATEGRHAGIHWTFAPVADLNLNPDNPITNTRGLGDDPIRVQTIATEIVRAMQSHGLAACAKHFPGDGVDDIDQHTATSINSLTSEEWLATFGETFRALFAPGTDVWSVMIGHIALPAFSDRQNQYDTPEPASINPDITTNLLRDELGFTGLVVTDDMNMGGVANHADRATRVPGCIAAGCDMLLFPSLPTDLDLLQQALEDGTLPESRVDDACQRVLEFKTKLGLLEPDADLSSPPPAETAKSEFAAASQEIAERAIYVVRGGHSPALRNLSPNSKILTVTLAPSSYFDLPLIDEGIRALGHEVEHHCNPADHQFFDNLPNYDAIFVNLVFKADWGLNFVRSHGAHNRIFIGGFLTERPNITVTSFGNPFHLSQLRDLPNLTNFHSDSPASQEAALKLWQGTLGARFLAPPLPLNFSF